jgi:hypothetical protein
VKWLVVGALSFTSVFAMHGLLVDYTGVWLHIYPGMSPNIPFNWAIYSLYINDTVISGMILVNLLMFLLIFSATFRKFYKPQDWKKFGLLVRKGIGFLRRLIVGKEKSLQGI